MKFEFDTTNLKKQVEQNPVLVVGAAAALLSGAAKLMNANTNRRNSSTWKKEVNRRTRATK